MIRVGLISDTHGLLRPQAVEALRGSDLIIHAGDIGGRGASQAAPVLLEELAQLAPTTCVRGNNDQGPWAAALPTSARLAAEKVWLYALHDIAKLDVDVRAEGLHVVISGHSHKPNVSWRDGVLFINPGSAGPRRFNLPTSVATLTVRGDAIEPALQTLPV